MFSANEPFGFFGERVTEDFVEIGTETRGGGSQTIGTPKLSILG